jgi:hypothetical protein
MLLSAFFRPKVEDHCVVAFRRMPCGNACLKLAPQACESSVFILPWKAD